MFQKHGCPLCRLLANSNDFRPPSLLRRHRQDDDFDIALHLAGEWHSVRCETRPLGVFLVRHLAVGRENRTWTTQQRHYSDPYCQHDTFTYVAHGTYTVESPSRRIHNAREYIFDVDVAFITPHDARTLRTLQADSACGTSDSWKLGARQDVTLTNGCATLGITVPQRQYDLAKIERSREQFRLLLGQTPTDGGSQATVDRRPTSFQAPLVQCSEELKSFLAYPGYQSASSSISSGAMAIIAPQRLLPATAMMSLLTLSLLCMRFY